MRKASASPKHNAWLCFPNYRERTVIRMTRKIGILLAVLIAIVSFLYASRAQTGENKWKKTITLPNGDVILDMNGEWGAFAENYGPWSEYGSYPQLVKITQEGSSFVGVRMMDDQWNQKGTPSMRGDLDANGFKNVYIVSAIGPSNANGQISEDGNKIVVDDGQKVRVTLTRK
jgi:hypothetical protein